MSWGDPTLLSRIEFTGPQDRQAGVCGHGQGDVAMPALVAADLVIVQTAPLLRR